MCVVVLVLAAADRCGGAATTRSLLSSLAQGASHRQDKTVCTIVYCNSRRLPHFQQLSVTHDMTKNERSEIQKKVEEAKQKEREEEKGEWGNTSGG